MPRVTVGSNRFDWVWSDEPAVSGPPRRDHLECVAALGYCAARCRPDRLRCAAGRAVRARTSGTRCAGAYLVGGIPRAADGGTDRFGVVGVESGARRALRGPGGRPRRPDLRGIASGLREDRSDVVRGADARRGCRAASRSTTSMPATCRSSTRSPTSISPDPDGTDVHLVSHGAAIRLIAARLVNMPAEFALKHHLKNTGSIELERTADGWTCTRWGLELPPFHTTDPGRTRPRPDGLSTGAAGAGMAEVSPSRWRGANRRKCRSGGRFRGPP